MIEHKSLSLQVKRADDSGFLVYAAAFGNVDHQGDRIEPGAFANLDAYVADGVVLLGHDANRLPVGYPESATQDDYGLLVKGKWHSTPTAQEARTIAAERMLAGKSVAASIGYEVLEYSHAEEDGRSIRVITKLNVYEFSFVNIPANQEARAVAVKTLNELERETATLLLDAKAGRKAEAKGRLKEVEGFGKRIKRIATAMAEAEELLGLSEPEESSSDEPEDTSNAEALEEARRKRAKRRKAEEESEEKEDDDDDDDDEEKFDGPDETSEYDDDDDKESEDDEEKESDDDDEPKGRLALLHKLRIRQLKGRSLAVALDDDD